jgi:hypothetical protein
MDLTGLNVLELDVSYFDSFMPSVFAGVFIKIETTGRLIGFVSTMEPRKSTATCMTGRLLC